MLYGPQSSGVGHPHQSGGSWATDGSPLWWSVGGLRAAAMTRWWSSSGAERARCPKNLRRIDFTLLETGKAPGDTPDCLVGSVPGVWNLQNFPQTTGVEGIETILLLKTLFGNENLYFAMHWSAFYFSLQSMTAYRTLRRH